MTREEKIKSVLVFCGSKPKDFCRDGYCALRELGKCPAYSMSDEELDCFLAIIEPEFWRKWKERNRNEGCTDKHPMKIRFERSISDETP